MPEQNLTQDEKRSVQVYARAAGLLYLIIIVLGVVGEAVIRKGVIVWGDPTATARRILESEFLWRMGIAGQLVLLVCAVALTAIWYVLLRPVNRNLALVVVGFGLVSLAVESLCALHLQAALTPLTSTALHKVADAQQLHVLSYLALVAHGETFGVALIFFGVQCLLVGHLVQKSGYFPGALGVMMKIAGACYLINSFTMFLYPPAQGVLFPAILLPAFIGESAMCLWLIIKGVNVASYGTREMKEPISASLSNSFK